MTISKKQLTQHLINQGHLTDQGLTRQARQRPCPRCRNPAIAGININGKDTWLDPQPIDAPTELRLLLDGQTTYSIHAQRDIVPRDKHWIRAYPPGHPHRPTHQQHHCA